MTIPKFPVVTPSFHSLLKQRVQEYFESTGKNTTGGWRILGKALFLMASFLATYLVLLIAQPSWPWAIGLCVLMALLIAAIGFNVMHDGGHGSFSKYPLVNKLAALTLNLLGGSAFMWNVKHNVIHHAYTNVHEVDDDLNAGIILRMSEHQRRIGLHRIQHIYFWLPYSLLYLFWIFFSDYNKYFSRRIGVTPLKKMKLKDHISFWSGKLLHAFLFMVLPIMLFGFINWLIGFLVMAMVGGFTLSIVFQLAHTVEHTHFPAVDANNPKLEDEWAVHQLKTTANFATRNRFVSWFVGGLNFQVEHHLFPVFRISITRPSTKLLRKPAASLRLLILNFQR
ncbi:MAG TPA: acyl-CoA desaturase [Phnomibacter sp.]|nr:acyl-CoA desaturase [Phnomibacter sp.]